MSDVATRLEALVAPVLEAGGLALYDLTIIGQGRARTVRISIERADGGPIDLETIAATSRELDPVFDGDDALRGAFTLEVSSPGLERPLRRPDHFRRARGQLVTCKTPGARLRGVLVHADDTGFELEVDGEPLHVDYADATNARTIFEWGPSGDDTRSTRPRKEKSKR